MRNEFKTSRQHTQWLNGCLTYLANPRMQDGIKLPHLEETETTAQIPRRLQRETSDKVEIASPSKRIQETTGEDQTIRTTPVVPSVVSYVKGPILPESAPTVPPSTLFKLP